MATISTNPAGPNVTIGTTVQVTVSGLTANDVISYTPPEGRTVTVPETGDPTMFNIDTTGMNRGQLQIRVSNPGPPPTVTIKNLILT